MRIHHYRPAVLLTVGAGLALALSGCSGGGGGKATADASYDCGPFSQYSNLSGKTVTIYTSIVAPEDAPYVEAFKPFEQCTGAKVTYEADKQFEQQILVRAEAGNPPDLAIVPQPGLLAQIVATGKAKPAPAPVAANVDKFWAPAWRTLGTVNGTLYAAPNAASVKSLVWYSPKDFSDHGYKVPTTLDELTALTKQIADAGNNKPWCVGIASGEATGWPMTDWLEDFVLRTAGPDVYDQWVSHQIPFDDPRIATALDAVGAYIKNPAYVNGGFGDVSSIATTTFQDAGLPILDGQCSLHRQASFYAANFPAGTKVAPDGDVYAFYLPGKDATTKPVLGAGDFVVAFSDRPEVAALQQYWSSDVWVNYQAKASSRINGGGWVTASTGLDPANLTNPVDQLSYQILTDPAAEFRFDGSDQMPAAVGSGTFWTGMTDWITGASTASVLSTIEASWPKS